MPSFTVTGLTTVSQTLNNGETGLVTVNGTLATSLNAISIFHASTTESSNVSIFGVVHSATVAAMVSIGTTGTTHITVGSQGALVTADDRASAIDMVVGSSFFLNNAGFVSGSAAAIRLFGASSTQIAQISNSGTIMGSGSASSRAITTDPSFERLSITNSGTIMAATAVSTDNDLTLDNSGTIQGAVRFEGFATIDNSGLIDGNITDQDQAGTEQSVLTNVGQINGDVALGSGNDQVMNGGEISGDINLSNGTNRLINAGGLILRNVFGGSGDDRIINSGTINGHVSLGSGNNIFDNRGGVLVGTVFGLEGNDSYYIDDANIDISDLSGFDTVFTTVNYRAADGIERIDALSQQGLELRGRAGNETISGNVGDDSLYGARGNDLLQGSLGDDFLYGGQGSDTLSGSEGENQIFGGEGDDSLYWFRTSETLDGGAGIDTLLFSVSIGGQSNVISLAGGLANALSSGGAVIATAALTSIENVAGGSTADTITGNNGVNVLRGDLGNDSLEGLGGDDTMLGEGDADTLRGGGSDDLLFGGTSNDSLFGDGANDTLIGGDGQDHLFGGSGSDVFDFNTVSESGPGGLADTIFDFKVASGIIDLVSIDANLSAPGDNAFAFVGTGAFTGSLAEVRFFQDAGTSTTVVQVRLAGDAVTDMEIVLTGLQTLTAANFLL